MGEKQREKIRALKEKKKLEKLQHENQLKQRNLHKTDKIYNDPHERTNKVYKASEKMATDYDKILKQREKIRAIKEKNRLQKNDPNYNQLKQRNAHRTNNLFGDAHEQVIKIKPIKHIEPKKSKNYNNKQKIMDPVSREIKEKRDEIQANIHNDDDDGSDEEMD